MIPIKQTAHKGIYLKLNTSSDADVIKRLDTQKNKQGYIKGLIRTDIDLDIFRNGMENGVIKVVQNGQCDNDNLEGNETEKD